jgi:hypothetical protein
VDTVPDPLLPLQSGSAGNRTRTSEHGHRITENIKYIRWGGVDWIGLAKERDKWRALVNAVMIPRVP